MNGTFGSMYGYKMVESQFAMSEEVTDFQRRSL